MDEATEKLKDVQDVMAGEASEAMADVTRRRMADAMKTE